MKESSIRKMQNQVLEACRNHAGFKNRVHNFSLTREERNPNAIQGMISGKLKDGSKIQAGEIVANYTINLKTKKININFIQEDSSVITEDLTAA